MKRKIVIKQSRNRLYIRDIDLRRLKPILNLEGISVYTSQEGKHTGAPRHYIEITQGFKLIELLRHDYIVTII